jgi:hypothetical protein
MGLTFRSDKGAPLTHTELDNNFREFFYSGSIRGSELVLHRSRSLDTELSLPFNNPVGEDYSIQFKSGVAQSGSNVAFTGSGDLLHDYRLKRTIITGSLIVTASYNEYAAIIEGATYLTGSQKTIGTFEISGSVNAYHINTPEVTASVGLTVGNFELRSGSYAFPGQTVSGPYIKLAGPNRFTTSSQILFADDETSVAPYHSGMGIRYDSETNILIIDSNEKLAPNTPLLKIFRNGNLEVVGNLITNDIEIDGLLSASAIDVTTNAIVRGDLTVQGTGSFAVVQTITSDELNVGSNFLTLNYNTPAVQTAGVRTVDSGSTTITSSFFFDNSTDDWKYDITNAGTTTGAVALFGPSSTGPSSGYAHNANNTLLKGTGTRHVANSTITDDGTTVNITATNLQLQGTTVNQNIKTLILPSNTTISAFGASLIDDTSAAAARTTLGLGSISTLNSIDISSHTNLTAGTGITLTGDTLSTNSTQISVGGDLTGNASTATVSKVNGVSITSGEATQIGNINTTAISTTQWGYLGTMNQNVSSTSNVSFNSISPAIGSTNGIRWTAGYGGYGGADAAYIAWYASDAAENGVLEINVGDDSNDNIYLNAAGGTDVANDLRVTGDVVAYYSSDERLKDNIVKLQNPIQKIKQLNGVEFDWNDNQDTYKGHDIGVIAQEVEKVLPELVTTRDNGYKAVRYEKIVALLIEAIKDQQSQIDELKSKL